MKDAHRQWNIKKTCTILQIILAIWQSKKRCWMVSSRLQKQHFILPLHCRRARLSLVRTTPFCKYQIKILIFKGTLNFQIKFLRCAGRRTINVLYMDRTVKWPFCVRDKKKISLWSVNWTFAILATKLCQACKLLPTKDLRKATFKGVDRRTVATVALLFHTMLYRDGYWYLKGVLSSQASSQNLVCDPSPTLNLPILKRSR